MAEIPKYHNEALMPLTMGSPYRVPHYAYNVYGLGPYVNEDLATEAYRTEWAAETPGLVASVPDALQKAGLGNFNGFLQQRTAEVVAAVLTTSPLQEHYRIIDVGAGTGDSAIAVAKLLPAEIRARTIFFLIDPSGKSLEEAKEKMKDQGVEYGTLEGTDLDILSQIQPEFADVLTGVASVHHHAKIPFELYARVLKPRGWAVFADWHQPIWEHPGSVYRFLQKFNWLDKEQGLENWLEAYPQSKNIPPLPEDPADRMAIRQITLFWSALGRPNNLYPLEGHRPVHRYVADMQHAGLDLNSADIRRLISSGVIAGNPHQILPDSSLLQVTVGQKIAA